MTNPLDLRQQIISLDSQVLISLTGQDNKKFLQGQISCHMDEITDQQSRLACHCNHKGRVQASFRVFSIENIIYLRLPKSVSQHLIDSFNKYAIFSKVEIKIDNNYQGLGFINWDKDSLIKLFQQLPEKTNEAVIINQGSLIRVESHDNTPRYEYWGPKESIERLKIKLTHDENHWQALEILSGIPTIYPQTIDKFTPHMINYHCINGVHFNKGCYTGQEIIARTHYLGKLKQHTYLFTVKTQDETIFNLEPGEALLDNMGTVINITAINDQIYILALCKDKALSDISITLKQLNLPYQLTT